MAGASARGAAPGDDGAPRSAPAAQPPRAPEPRPPRAKRARGEHGAPARLGRCFEPRDDHRLDLAEVGAHVLAAVDDEGRVAAHAAQQGLEEALQRRYVHETEPHARAVALALGAGPGGE